MRFKYGDLVHIGEMCESMRHFSGDIDAIVLYSYASKYSGTDEHSLNSYGLHLKGGGECSWYYGQQLTLIEHGREDLLKEWEAEECDLPPSGQPIGTMLTDPKDIAAHLATMDPCGNKGCIREK